MVRPGQSGTAVTGDKTLEEMLGYDFMRLLQGTVEEGGIGGKKESKTEDEFGKVKKSVLREEGVSK